MKCYIARANENYDRRKSASGGIWQVISSKCISDNWIVYGAAFSGDFQVQHIRCTTLDDLKKTYGTKYVQSNLGFTIRQILKDLSEGKKVLFAGTPCQVSAVRNCTKNNENIVLCDIICHGVLSNSLFSAYVNWLEKKNKSTLKAFTFREKSKGMSKQRWEATFANGKHCTDIDVYAYNRIFYSDKMLRDSCYSCKFASLNRPGDITIGDVHSHSEVATLIGSDDFGISSVITNTQLGEELFRTFSDEFIFAECECKDIMQPQLKTPTKKKDGNEEWSTFAKEGFSGLIEKHFAVTTKDRVIHSLKDIKRKLR